MIGHFSQDSLIAVARALSTSTYNYGFSEGVFDFKVCEKADGTRYGIPQDSQCASPNKEVSGKPTTSGLTKEEKEEVLSEWSGEAMVEFRKFEQENPNGDTNAFKAEWKKYVKGQLKDSEREERYKTLTSLHEDPQFYHAVTELLPTFAQITQYMADNLSAAKQEAKSKQNAPEIEELKSELNSRLLQQQSEYSKLAKEILAMPPGPELEKKWKQSWDLWEEHQASVKSLPGTVNRAIDVYNARHASQTPLGLGNEAIDPRAWGADPSKSARNHPWSIGTSICKGLRGRAWSDCMKAAGN